jgi:hypothetical protein
MEKTPGDELGLKVEHMKYVWGAVFVIVALFGYGMTKWEVLEHLAEKPGGG